MDVRFCDFFEEGFETCTVEDLDFVPFLEAAGLLTLLEAETLVLLTLLAVVDLDFFDPLTAVDLGFFLLIFGSLIFQLVGFT